MVSNGLRNESAEPDEDNHEEETDEVCLVCLLPVDECECDDDDDEEE